MSKALLTHSYFYKLDAKQWKFKQPYPPLGTLLAASVLRESGVDVIFEDACLQDGPQAIIAGIQGHKPKYVVIYDDGFNYLTKMCLTAMREAAFEMIRAAKRSGSIVVVCNSDSSDHYDQYLAQGADYVIRGEGEDTLQELIEALEANGASKNISGIAFRESSEIRVNSSRPVLHDLDSLSLPAWDLVNMEDYRKIWMKHHGYFSLNVATTRGCPFKCNWCAKPIYGNRYNLRSPEHVVNEIEHLLQLHRPDHFWFCDDIFGLKPGWISQFNAILNKKKLAIRYKIQSRADLLLEKDTIHALSSSGAETVWIGAESGSQKILDSMDKGTTVSQIRSATQMLKQAGIKVGFFLQFGYPGETKEDIDQTLRLTLDLMPHEIGISVSYPLPGTKFYEKVKIDLQEKQNWTDSDDLEMLFKNTYSPGYYKVLHRYVHSRFRIKRGMERLADLIRRPQLNFSDFRRIASMIYHIPLSLIGLYQLRKSSATHV